MYLNLLLRSIRFAALTALILTASVFGQAALAGWIDVKTGKPITSRPVLLNDPSDYSKGVRIVHSDIGDSKRAYDSQTGRNFALDNCGNWIDVKTGKPVTSRPVLLNDPSDYSKGVCIIHADIGDPKRAYDPVTGRNFADVPCVSPAPTTQSKTTGTIDSCLIGTWRSESGTVSATGGVHTATGGAGILLTVKSDKTAMIDYNGMKEIKNSFMGRVLTTNLWQGTATGHISSDSDFVKVVSVEKSALTGKETGQYGSRATSASGLGPVFLGGGKTPSPYDFKYACNETTLTIKRMLKNDEMGTFVFKREKKEP